MLAIGCLAAIVTGVVAVGATHTLNHPKAVIANASPALAGDSTGPYVGRSDAQIAAMFLEDGPWVSSVTRVAVKRTTWGAFFPVSGLAALPQHATAMSVIDVVVQAGTVNPNAASPYSSIPAGREYKVVINVVNPVPSQAAEVVVTEPNIAWPSWFASLLGPETDLTR
jgi:hypothetical protein